MSVFRCPPARPCNRCGILAENVEPIAGRIPNGKGGTVKSKDIILCWDCRNLQYTDLTKFWNQGWNVTK